MMRRSGSSLIELLVVIGIVGILFGLLLAAVQAVRESAARTRCQNQLKQIGLALHGFNTAHGRIPPLPTKAYPNPDPNAVLGWMALILPHIEQSDLYLRSLQACKIDLDPRRNPPHVGFATPMPAYRCSNDGRLDSALTDPWGITAAFTSYIGVAGAFNEATKTFLDGPFTFEGGTRFIDVTDGLSQTLMVGERPPPGNLQAGWWYPSFLGATNHFVGPNNVMSFGNVLQWFGDNDCAGARRGFFGPGALDNPCDRYHFWSLHPGGGNWLFADGSVRFLAYSADPIMPALATRAGGEAVTLPD